MRIASSLVLGIALLPQFRGQGIGVESVRLFMDAFRSALGPVSFAAHVDARNAVRMNLLKKLGFKPRGIKAFPIIDSDHLERFEEEHMDKLDDSMILFAEGIGVAPRKLFGHLVVFQRD